MKARRMMLGIGLLALAGGLIGRHMGIIPDLPVSKIVLCGIAAVLAVDGIRHKNFFLMILPIAFIWNRFPFREDCSKCGSRTCWA